MSGTAGRRPASRHARKKARHERRRRVLTGTLAGVLFLATGLGLAYSNLQGNISRHDIDDLVGEDGPAGRNGDGRPVDPQAGEALNVLVIGSDVRGEDEADAPAVDGMRADATMIAHVSADRSRLEVVSIPRDTLVDIPTCRLPDGTETPERPDTIFNSAFSVGGEDVATGAACVIRTVQAMTQIRIDDFVVVDFAGFEAVVDSLNGVPMHIPDPVDDERAQVRLAAGCQVLGGRDALGYARARYSLDDGTDIHRIGRQQQLLAAIAREALNVELLTDLPALYGFLDASTKTLTTGEWVGRLPNMAGVANSLRGIEPDEIRFATMPFEWAGARVVPAPQAEALWENLLNDRPIDADILGTGEEPPAEKPGSEEQTTEDMTSEEPATQGPTTDEPASDHPTENPSPPECTR